MTWVCDDCQDELISEEAACSCEEFDRARLIQHIASLNRHVRSLAGQLRELSPCHDCGRAEGHDPTCFYHGPY